MALFDEPYRHVPQPHAATPMPGADVAVVDAVTAPEPVSAADPAPAAGVRDVPAPVADPASAAAPAAVEPDVAAPVVAAEPAVPAARVAEAVVTPPPSPGVVEPEAVVTPPTSPAALEPEAVVTPRPSPAAVEPVPVVTPAVSRSAVDIVPRDEHGLRPAGEPDGLIEFTRIVPGEAKSAPRDTLRLISAMDDAEPVLDQLRSLAASLHQARTGRELKIIAVTSSVSGEGKTVLAANLALTLTRSYMRRVLMIDADLRRPNLHRLFGTPSTSGIRDALDAVRDGKPVSVQEVAPRLALLPAGKPVRDPISVLASDAMQRLVLSASHAFDWIVIDTPPVGMLPDVGLLSSLSDAVLLVVEAGRVRYDLVQRTVESIGADRIFGVVLNKVPEHEIVAAYGMHYYAPYR